MKDSKASFKQSEVYVKNHRIAQRQHCQKLNKNNTIHAKLF